MNDAGGAKHRLAAPEQGPHSLRRPSSHHTSLFFARKHTGATNYTYLCRASLAGRSPLALASHQSKDVESDRMLLFRGERLVSDQGEEQFGECWHARIINTGITRASFEAFAPM